MIIVHKWSVFFILVFDSFNIFAEPTFKFDSDILHLPTVRVDGKLFRNVNVVLRSDGTWGLLSIDEMPVTTNPICDIERKIARSDALADYTERYSPSFSLIESLLQSAMEAYDTICAMDETPVLLEILNNRAERYYPGFSLILSLTECDLEAFENLKN